MLGMANLRISVDAELKAEIESLAVREARSTSNLVGVLLRPALEERRQLVERQEREMAAITGIRPAA